MANRLKIEIVGNPTSGQTLYFIVKCAALSHTHIISKTWVTMPGMPTNPASVKLVANPAARLQYLFDNLVSSETDSLCSFEKVGSVIYMNFDTTEEVELQLYNPYTWLSLSMESVPVPAEPVSATAESPVNIDMMMIEIIDTDTNERILIDELAEDSKINLKYESGDDIFHSVFASELAFNMLVKNAADAAFIHLFTGNEMRYLVKLSSIDQDENVELLWQGYLLPDQYKEPYKNVNFFVDFLAIDMLASLKGKYFDTWVYYQKFTNPELLSMILAFTGISQNIIVKPTLVNQVIADWGRMIVPMEKYIKDGKPEDLYSILQKVLESQGLTILSFRGNWIVEGFTRKGESAGECYKYDAAGVRTTEDPLFYPKFLTTAVAHAGSVNFTSITPFKAVNIDFSVDTSKNLFSDDVVARKSDFVGYIDDHYDETTPASTNFRQWLKVGANNVKFFNPEREFSYTPIYHYDPYDEIGPFTEADALANYFECKETPFVSSGKNYQFEIEFEVELYFGFDFSAESMQAHINAGNFDKMALFQLLLNDTEIRSNRPSSPTLALNKFDEIKVVSYQVVQGQSDLGNLRYTLSYKLKRDFGVSEDGYLKLRIAPPLTDVGFAFSSFGLRGFINRVKTLKCTLLDADVDESVRAVRSVGFTQEKDFTLPITCSINTAIPNSFSLGVRVGSKEIEIPVIDQEDTLYYQIFPPLNNLEIQLKKFLITDDVYRRLFSDGKTKSLFLVKADGSKVHFYSVYNRKYFIVGSSVVMSPQLYYLIDYDGRPFLPKDYKRLPEIVSGDVLKMLISDFSDEEVSEREMWYVYGFPEWLETFPKTLANAFHCVRKEPFFNYEGKLMFILFPDQLLQFMFAGAERVFIPTRIDIDLVGSNTTVNAKEYTINQLNDITYE